MFSSCPLCASTNLTFHSHFPDKVNNQVELAKCGDCHCFIPQYEHDSTPNTIKQQTSFHEYWWKNSSSEELKKTLDDLTTVVRGFQPYLGEPSPENLVVEIGSGRGSLLRALLDTGYQAYGCEPATGLVELARTHYSLGTDSLYEMPAFEFLEEIIPRLPIAPKTIFLWHVLEHLEQPMPLLHKLQNILPPNGRMILQLPLLSQEYVYPEHYFFVTHKTFEYISSELNLKTELIEYDSDNLFVTLCLRKSPPTPSSIKIDFLHTNIAPSGMAQGILLRDDLIRALRSVIEDRDATIAALNRVVEENISCIQSQTSLIDERVIGMEKMEQIIQERDTAIRAQAALIDEQALAIKEMDEIIRTQKEDMTRLQQKIYEHESLIQKQEMLIRDHDVSIINLDKNLRTTREELDYYKNSPLVKIARKTRILN